MPVISDRSSKGLREPRLGFGLRKGVALAALGALLAASACASDSSPTFVVLNERVVAADGTSAGSGCVTYGLGEGSAKVQTETSVPGPGALRAKQSGSGGPVTVQILDGTTLLLERRYDEAFFSQHGDDSFTVSDASGRAWSFRYWGAPKEGGCTPLEQASP